MIFEKPPPPPPLPPGSVGRFIHGRQANPCHIRALHWTASPVPTEVSAANCCVVVHSPEIQAEVEEKVNFVLNDPRPVDEKQEIIAKVRAAAQSRALALSGGVC